MIVHPTYPDLLKQFGDSRGVDRAIAKAFLGYKNYGAPPEWDWNAIIEGYHKREATLALLIDLALRKIGTDVESEL